jgi:hypothetical protein
MTMPRRQLVDVAVPRYYHCISRCVRRAFLCGEGVTHRKAWIEARLELLAKHFGKKRCQPPNLENPGNHAAKTPRFGGWHLFL